MLACSKSRIAQHDVTCNRSLLIVRTGDQPTVSALNFSDAWTRDVEHRQRHLPTFCLSMSKFVKIERFRILMAPGDVLEPNM